MPQSHDPHPPLESRVASLDAVCTHWLEVRDGETADRLRPLLADRVLIGSGSQCHIQIASDEVAMVHAVLRRHREGDRTVLEIEALAPHPAVLINGEAVHERRLEEGDLIGLAGVNLALLGDLAEAAVAEAVPQGPPASESPVDLSLFEDADGLTADEFAGADDLNGFGDEALEDQLDALDLAAEENTLGESETAEPRVEAMSANELVDAIERDLTLIDDLAGTLDEVERPVRPLLGRDPHRVRGLATLLQAAREFRNVEGETGEPSTIPIPTTTRATRGAITPRDAA